MAGPALVIATGNLGKIREFSAMLGDLGLTLRTLAEFPECPEVAEDGATFEANAAKKARAVAACTGLAALADDSGLEVEALGGRPGVFSARYARDRTAPEKPTDRDNYRKLLDEMRDIPWPERRARFVCSIVVAFPGGRTAAARGTCEGLINLRPQGTGGFGYDPVFWVPEYDSTMAEVGPEIKNRISHRAAALKQIKATLAELLREEPALFQAAKANGT
jgi:XTP/dITP diphosphohydrolase